LVASAKRDNGSGVKKELWLIDAASGQSRYLCDGSNAHWLANRTIVAIHGQYLHLIAAESGLLCCSMPLSIKDSHLMDVARLRLIAGIGSRDGGVARNRSRPGVNCSSRRGENWRNPRHDAAADHAGAVSRLAA
jgi:hypothetical protein